MYIRFVGACYVSDAPAETKTAQQKPRCATVRVEAVTSLDILYDRYSIYNNNLIQ